MILAKNFSKIFDFAAQPPKALKPLLQYYMNGKSIHVFTQRLAGYFMCVVEQDVISVIYHFLFLHYDQHDHQYGCMGVPLFVKSPNKNKDLFIHL